MMIEDKDKVEEFEEQEDEENGLFEHFHLVVDSGQGTVKD